MTGKPIIQIANLTVKYDALVAVNDISLQVPEGAIFGLVGPNGAGKTTTLKVLAGLILPDSGTVTVDGFDLLKERRRARMRIGYMADFFGVYDYLSVAEYLEFFGGMYGLEHPRLRERIDAMLETVNLVQKHDALVKTLSRGMKQRLYCARALVHAPRLLILDEPASGMDPRGRTELIATLKAVNQQGTTIIISSHILDELQNLCTEVGVMETGRLVGTRDLRADSGQPVVRRVILLVTPTDTEKALGLLRTHPKVISLKDVGGGLLLELPNEDQVVSDIVRFLAQANVRILLPRADAADLKEIFLKMTKGELM
ncbi:MAG: ABC transporter ATP-binding protein [Lentisphaerae bacterium]|nr:ABC transporter ATP-binding protein [Lentisphaerota bacterium]